MVTALPAAVEVGGAGGAGAIGAMELSPAIKEEEITVKVDMAMLHCPLCFLPLKPPISQCQIGHLACGTCRARLPTSRCRMCARGTGAYALCPGLDVFFRAVKVAYPYDIYGCRRHIAYFDVDDHARVCPCTPCCCPEPGCAFVGSPPALVGHLEAAHARPTTTIRYGAAQRISLPASRRWHVLVAEDDEAVFLLTLTELGAGAVVSVARVRASSDGAAAQYACRLAVDVPNDAGDDKVRALVMEWKVGSTALSPGGGAAAPAYGAFVRRDMLAGGALELSVRISRLPAAGAVVAGGANSEVSPSPLGPHLLGAPSCKLAVIRN